MPLPYGEEQNDRERSISAFAILNSAIAEFGLTDDIDSVNVCRYVSGLIKEMEDLCLRNGE